MANIYNFTDDNLLLSADKVTQFTAALATGAIPDPLQQLCDEAAADVGRMIAGYNVDVTSISNFIRAIAVYNAYVNSGTEAPPDVTNRYKYVMEELAAIAEGKRPNLGKVQDPNQVSIAGGGGSGCPLHGRTHERRL